MSIACKCERCGKLYEPNLDDEACVPTEVRPLAFNNVTLNHMTYKNNKNVYVGFSNMDICPACARSFTRWWTNPDVVFNGSDE